MITPLNQHDIGLCASGMLDDIAGLFFYNPEYHQLLFFG
jgi:hypothetical protein